MQILLLLLFAPNILAQYYDTVIISRQNSTEPRSLFKLKSESESGLPSASIIRKIEGPRKSFNGEHGRKVQRRILPLASTLPLGMSRNSSSYPLQFTQNQLTQEAKLSDYIQAVPLPSLYFLDGSSKEISNQKELPTQLVHRPPPQIRISKYSKLNSNQRVQAKNEFSIELSNKNRSNTFLFTKPDLPEESRSSGLRSTKNQTGPSHRPSTMITNTTPLITSLPTSTLSNKHTKLIPTTTKKYPSKNKFDQISRLIELALARQRDLQTQTNRQGRQFSPDLISLPHNPINDYMTMKEKDFGKMKQDEIKVEPTSKPILETMHMSSTTPPKVVHGLPIVPVSDSEKYDSNKVPNGQLEILKSASVYANDVPFVVYEGKSSNSTKDVIHLEIDKNVFNQGLLDGSVNVSLSDACAFLLRITGRCNLGQTTALSTTPANSSPNSDAQKNTPEQEISILENEKLKISQFGYSQSAIETQTIQTTLTIQTSSQAQKTSGYQNRIKSLNIIIEPSSNSKQVGPPGSKLAEAYKRVFKNFNASSEQKHIAVLPSAISQEATEGPIISIDDNVPIELDGSIDLTRGTIETDISPNKYTEIEAIKSSSDGTPPDLLSESFNQQSNLAGMFNKQQLNHDENVVTKTPTSTELHGLRLAEEYERDLTRPHEGILSISVLPSAINHEVLDEANEPIATTGESIKTIETQLSDLANQAKLPESNENGLKTRQEAISEVPMDMINAITEGPIEEAKNKEERMKMPLPESTSSEPPSFIIKSSDNVPQIQPLSSTISPDELERIQANYENPDDMGHKDTATIINTTSDYGDLPYKSKVYDSSAEPLTHSLLKEADLDLLPYEDEATSYIPSEQEHPVQENTNQDYENQGKDYEDGKIPGIIDSTSYHSSSDAKSDKQESSLLEPTETGTDTDFGIDTATDTDSAKNLRPVNKCPVDDENFCNSINMSNNYQENSTTEEPVVEESYGIPTNTGSDGYANEQLGGYTGAEGSYGPGGNGAGSSDGPNQNYGLNPYQSCSGNSYCPSRRPTFGTFEPSCVATLRQNCRMQCVPSTPQGAPCLSSYSPDCIYTQYCCCPVQQISLCDLIRGVARTLGLCNG